jgi:hypothetical protein
MGMYVVPLFQCASLRFRSCSGSDKRDRGRAPIPDREALRPSVPPSVPTASPVTCSSPGGGESNAHADDRRRDRGADARATGGRRAGALKLDRLRGLADRPRRRGTASVALLAVLCLAVGFGAGWAVFKKPWQSNTATDYSSVTSIEDNSAKAVKHGVLDVSCQEDHGPFYTCTACTDRNAGRGYDVTVRPSGRCLTADVDSNCPRRIASGSGARRTSARGRADKPARDGRCRFS